MKFKKDDLVQAIQDSAGCNHYTKNQIYRVLDISGDTIHTYDNNNNFNGWNKKFFRLVNLTKLEKLIYNITT